VLAIASLASRAIRAIAAVAVEEESQLTRPRPPALETADASSA
jgi:hypothetical protein